MITHFLWYRRLYLAVILWSWTVMIAKAVRCGRCVRVFDGLIGLMLCDYWMSMYSSVYLIIGRRRCIVLSLQYVRTLFSLIVLFHPHVFSNNDYEDLFCGRNFQKQMILLNVSN